LGFGTGGRHHTTTNSCRYRQGSHKTTRPQSDILQWCRVRARSRICSEFYRISGNGTTVHDLLPGYAESRYIHIDLAPTPAPISIQPTPPTAPPPGTPTGTIQAALTPSINQRKSLPPLLFLPAYFTSTPTHQCTYTVAVAVDGKTEVRNKPHGSCPSCCCS
jgi:hypothetical protein